MVVILSAVQADRKLYSAKWLCGLPAPTVPGWSGLTEFQSHERWNGNLKSAMPGKEHHQQTLATVTSRANCSLRSLFRHREWVDEAEIVPENAVIDGYAWPCGIHSNWICQRLVTGAPVMCERMEYEDSRKSNVAAVFTDLNQIDR